MNVLKYETQKKGSYLSRIWYISANVGTTLGTGGTQWGPGVPNLAEITLLVSLPILHPFSCACPDHPTQFALLCAPKLLTLLSAYCSHSQRQIPLCESLFLPIQTSFPWTNEVRLPKDKHHFFHIKLSPSSQRGEEKKMGTRWTFADWLGGGGRWKGPFGKTWISFFHF